MRNKVLILVIGILIGAIITTSAFLIYNEAVLKNQKKQETMQMEKNRQGGPLLNENMEEPPAMPNDKADPEKHQS